METAIVLVATVVAIVASLYLFGLSQVDHVKKNWVQYRCNPIYMPMAGMVGDDVVSNFTKCTMKGFHDYTGFVMDPIMAEFSTVNDTIGEIGSTMSSMRSMMSGVRGGFLGIIGSVFGKIQNVMSQTQYIVIRMRTLMSRVVAIMFSFVYIFYGGMQSGQSLVNGPVGKTMNFLCFDENTKIQTARGKFAMKDVVLGDILMENTAKVTSIYRLDGTGIQMYKIKDILVTGSHKMAYKGRFIRVDKHPLAEKVNTQSKHLVCFNTSSHRIRIDGFDFLDFVESHHTSVLRFKNEYIQHLYNGTTDHRIYTDPTGLLPETMIPIEDGISPIHMISVGQKLDNGETVKGIVAHSIPGNVPYVEIGSGVLVTPSTWVYQNQKIQRAAEIGNMCIDVSLQPKMFYQLITDNSMFPITNPNGDRFFVLDELETTDPYFHKIKDRIITAGCFPNKRLVV
jgi:hypothetical protein